MKKLSHTDQWPSESPERLASSSQPQPSSIAPPLSAWPRHLIVPSASGPHRPAAYEYLPIAARPDPNRFPSDTFVETLPARLHRGYPSAVPSRGHRPASYSQAVVAAVAWELPPAVAGAQLWETAPAVVPAPLWLPRPQSPRPAWLHNRPSTTPPYALQPQPEMHRSLGWHPWNRHPASRWCRAAHRRSTAFHLAESG